MELCVGVANRSQQPESGRSIVGESCGKTVATEHKAHRKSNDFGKADILALTMERATELLLVRE